MNTHGQPSTTRPRILHVITGLGPGGAEAVLFRLIRNSKQFEHEVISLGPRDWYSGKLEAEGIKVEHLCWSSALATFRAVGRLFRLVKSSKADVLQAWMYRANLFGGIAGRAAGKRVIWNVRSSSVAQLRPSSRFLAYAGGFLARWIPDVVVNCSANSAELHATWGYGVPPGRVISNGFDAAPFSPNDDIRNEVRGRLGANHETFLIGSIARWHPKKGLPLLIDAFRELQSRYSDIRLVLVGRGLVAQNGELAELISASGAAELIETLGERGDIPDLARAFDLHVLASIGGEGFPNAVAETMLAATPNVVTDTGDSAAIVADAGWVVKPGCVNELTAAIELAYLEWKDRPERWNARRGRARRHIGNHFTLDAMVAEYERLWNGFARPPLAQARRERRQRPG